MAEAGPSDSPPLSLVDVVALLERFYGALASPPRDGFRLFVWDTLSVQTTTSRRDSAYGALQRLPALTPDSMWRTPRATLEAAVALCGGYQEQRLRVLRAGVAVFVAIRGSERRCAGRSGRPAARSPCCRRLARRACTGCCCSPATTWCCRSIATLPVLRSVSGWRRMPVTIHRAEPGGALSSGTSREFRRHFSARRSTCDITRRRPAPWTRTARSVQSPPTADPRGILPPDRCRGHENTKNTKTR